MKNRADLQSLQRWIKICVAILVVLMLRVWENVQAQRLERRLTLMRAEADRLTYDNGRLQMQIHQYVAPSNLEAIAKQESYGPLASSRRIGIQP
jgi:hypothetical protein